MLIELRDAFDVDRISDTDPSIHTLVIDAIPDARLRRKFRDMKVKRGEADYDMNLSIGVDQAQSQIEMYHLIRKKLKLSE